MTKRERLEEILKDSHQVYMHTVSPLSDPSTQEKYLNSRVNRTLDQILEVMKVEKETVVESLIQKPFWVAQSKDKVISKRDIAKAICKHINGG